MVSLNSARLAPFEALVSFELLFFRSSRDPARSALVLPDQDDNFGFDMAEPSKDEFAEPVQLPINGVLDLHTVQPREVKDVLLAYLEVCQEKGILEIRVIHGKGIGNLQRTVHAILKKHPDVISFVQASELYGGSGATMIKIRGSRR